MLENAENNLLNHQKEIDAKNVFPVPDGDTGTNMTMTFQNGVLESKQIMQDSVGAIAKALSHGLLMGARGNSGVITSQIFRGFYIDEFDDLMSSFEDVEHLHTVATDGMTHQMREFVEALDDEGFEIWKQYCLYTCERKDLQGFSNHMLWIGRKIRS